MFKEVFKNLEEKTPLIHCITNFVTVNDCANALLAVNASPIMADAEEEVEDITSITNALVINIGTLNNGAIKSMIKAGKKANELNKPVILDPVGAGASTLRNDAIFKLLQEVKFTAIRGNISEIKTIYMKSGTTKGVDADINDLVSDDNLQETVNFARELSKQTGAIIVITGAIDIVSDSNDTYVIKNGCKEMSRITGTGCMLSAILAGFISANLDDKLKASACCVATMGYSGELAKEKVVANDLGTSSMRTFIIDNLSKMDNELLSRGIKLEKF